MRKSRGNGGRMRKWREFHSLHFLILSLFPPSLLISYIKISCITFCRKMLNTALLSRMSQKNIPTRYEEILLGQFRCEEAPQVVPACNCACLLSAFFVYSRKHPKNCKCCLGHHLILNHYSSMP